MPIEASEVARMLVMHAAWRQVWTSAKQVKWAASIDGITNSKRRAELVRSLQELCPSATAELVGITTERVWTVLVEPLELKEVREHLRNLRDPSGRFVGRGPTGNRAR